MARLVTDNECADAKSRLAGIRLANLTLRLRSAWTELFGSADTAAIALAIVAITSERLLRESLATELESLKVPMPSDAFGTCNISSIAQATGLNRETARRKVDEMIDRGMVVRHGSRIILAPGFTQRPEVMEMLRTQLDALRKTTNELIRDGVITVQD